MESEEYDETIKRMAYSEAMKLQGSGLDNETIYARLEKQGIPQNLILRVLANMRQEQQLKVKKDLDFNYRLAFFQIGAGIAASIVSAILLPGNAIIPIGLIVGGIILAITANKKENKNR